MQREYSMPADTEHLPVAGDMAGRQALDHAIAQARRSWSAKSISVPGLSAARRVLPVPGAHGTEDVAWLVSFSADEPGMTWITDDMDPLCAPDELIAGTILSCWDECFDCVLDEGCDAGPLDFQFCLRYRCVSPS